jgi:hypothetical protein
METTMNRILEVTDEDETPVLEYIDLGDIRNERILLIPARELTRGNSLTTGCFPVFHPARPLGTPPSTLEAGPLGSGAKRYHQSTYGGA